LWTLDNDDLVTFGSGPGPLAGDGQRVLFDDEVDRVGIHARDVEVHNKLVAAAVRVHWHLPRSRRSGKLRRYSVELAQRIEPYKHLARLSSVSSRYRPIGRCALDFSRHTTPVP
jgi:hypothetical protein